MTNSTVSTCPTWCEQHTTEEGVTYHEANVIGDGWDLILTHDETEGSSVSIGLKRDPLPPSEAFVIGVALIEAATTIGQAEAVQEGATSANDGGPQGGRPFADLLAGELRRGGWDLTRIIPTDARTPNAPTVPSLESVRRTYAYGEDSTREGFEAAGEAFDAWLAAHDAELLGNNGQGAAR